MDAMSKKLCIWGDSITWGANDSELGGWVNRLRLFIESQNTDVRVYNLGISADTTTNVLERFRAEAKARVPDMIVFALGVNDSSYITSEDNPVVSLEKFITNLTDILRQAKEFTNTIAFIGITPVDESKCKPLSNRPDIYTTTIRE